MVPDAVAVRKVRIVRGIENRTPGRSQMPPQNVLTARLGKQRVVKPVAIDQAGQVAQFDVRPPLRHEPLVAQHTGRHVPMRDEHGVVRQQREQRLRVAGGEVAVGTVVQRPVHRDGPGKKPQAGQRGSNRDAGRPLRAVRLRPDLRPEQPRHPCRQPLQREGQPKRQPEREQPVADQRVGAEDGDAVEVELELQQQDQHQAVAQEHQRRRRRLQEAPALDEGEQPQHGQREAQGRQLPERLLAEPAEKGHSVAPSGDGIGVLLGVAAAADIVPEGVPVGDGAVEADEGFLQ